MRKNSNTTDYQSKEHETVDRWTEDMLLDVIPENEASARRYLGACNYYECSTEVKEHFADCIRRLEG